MARTTSSKKLWGGRFRQPTHPLLELFSWSLPFDLPLARYDVEGSIAHARMLGRTRIVASHDSARLVRGLQGLLRDIERGTFPQQASITTHVEDIHTLVQQALERRIGPVARTLHTARSRNDQIALDLRLYARAQVDTIDRNLRQVQRALVAKALQHADVVVPGYTHLQRAQPVLLAHHWLAYVEMFQRDRERLQEARARINVLPLGAGALAGTSLPIDRAFVATQLGMTAVTANSMDGVADRDFLIEVLADVALLGTHLSRLAEDWVLWSSQEFGFLELSDAFATGSSLMPQKKNPDGLELMRGLSGRLTGALMSTLAIVKGLPLTYNRDLQWGTQPLVEACQFTNTALALLATMVPAVIVHATRTAHAAADEGLCATDLAEWLVGQDVAFRDAHDAVGRLIAWSHDTGRSLRDASLAEWRRFSPAFTAEAQRLLDPRRSIARKRSSGSTHPRQVRAALAAWKRKLTVHSP